MRAAAGIEREFNRHELSGERARQARGVDYFGGDEPGARRGVLRVVGECRTGQDERGERGGEEVFHGGSLLGGEMYIGFILAPGNSKVCRGRALPFATAVPA